MYLESEAAPNSSLRRSFPSVLVLERRKGKKRKRKEKKRKRKERRNRRDEVRARYRDCDNENKVPRDSSQSPCGIPSLTQPPIPAGFSGVNRILDFAREDSDLRRRRVGAGRGIFRNELFADLCLRSQRAPFPVRLVAVDPGDLVGILACPVGLLELVARFHPLR